MCFPCRKPGNGSWPWDISVFLLFFPPGPIPQEVLQAFQQISEEYSAIHGYQIAVNLDEIMDTGLPKKKLLAIDYDRVEREMKEMTLRFLDGFRKRIPPERYTEEAYIRQLFHALKEFLPGRKGKLEPIYCCLRKWAHSAEPGPPGEPVPATIPPGMRAPSVMVTFRICSGSLREIILVNTEKSAYPAWPSPFARGG